MASHSLRARPWTFTSTATAVQSFSDDHMGHLWGDVPALLLVAVVLSVLVLSSGLKQSAAAPSSAR
jgi:hypothetical protein